ncbi:hypothetical protein [Aquimarina sp. MMG016]|uniref:alginate O-acetyltransferase AlgX-related protein n=1 Tax=Aquimarina sp. MMG016 TaxID=2822690 RepID=UPI001B3A3AC7|nr:hypothetical protein [Aquimarina sp. MMG016]MBQ4819131.1 hypothetical protein [Aquimarina sp. MMG016]
MKRFILKILYFLIFVLALMSIIELSIPQQYITYRSWEAFKIGSKDLFTGPFYPNKKIIRDEYGDLAHHTDYSVLKKNITWQTDELGFRNEKVIDSPDLIFLGTSNIAGCSVSQEQNISSRVSQLSGLSSYNMAPYSFLEFTRLLNAGVIKKPKVLIFGLIERALPYLYVSKMEEEESWVKSNYIRLKNTTPFQSCATTIDHISKRNFQHFATARVNNSTGNGIQSTINNKMFYFQGKNAKIEATDEVVGYNVDIITKYRDFCKREGIEFIFFPVPNKETIYYEYVPFEKQPIYLKKLHIGLKNQNINAINTLELYNKEKPNTLLYHYDDTHWNTNGIHLVAKEIHQLLKKMNLKKL